ncbi:MAG TPA: hypothetical protein VNA17_09160 [Pyrinomonadaceae bacterium]|nr:hypothetical protein [Pyrinomonadaceae bacterium]
MHTEIVNQINQLPPEERVEIIEEVSRGLKRDLRKNSALTLTDAERQMRREAFERLRGIASVPGKAPPNDEEVKESYIDYISEKYK